MGRKRKHKIRQLLPGEEFQQGDFKQEDEEDSELFRKALEETDWQQVALEKEAPEEKKKKFKARKKHGLVDSIDLHGFTLEKAKEALCLQIAAALQTNYDTLELTIITGKGRNSAGGIGVLAREIPEYVKRKWRSRILSCDESPANLNLNGRLLKGHFTIKLNLKG